MSDNLDITDIVSKTSSNPFVSNPSKTNFEKVVKFNKLFGVTVNNMPQTEITTSNPMLVKLRLALITEEYHELLDACNNNDFPEIIDALSDILYVVYGMGASIGVNLDKSFGAVHCSNMSKLCRTEEEAIETVKHYQEQYEQNKSPYDTPSIRPGNEAKDYWVVYNKSTGKILKNINYHPVDFSHYK